MIVLPTPPTANSTSEVVINGKAISIKYEFNSRNNHWYMSFSTNGVVVVSGVKIVRSGLIGLGNIALEELLGGAIMVVSSVPTDEDFNEYSLGINKATSLLYASNLELAI